MLEYPCGSASGRGRAVIGHLSRVPICLPQLQAKAVLSCRPRLGPKGGSASGVLTDLDHNVDDLLRLYEQPEAFSDDEIRDIIIRFLAHVPNHVAAAGEAGRDRAD